MIEITSIYRTCEVNCIGVEGYFKMCESVEICRRRSAFRF